MSVLRERLPGLVATRVEKVLENPSLINSPGMCRGKVNT